MATIALASCVMDVSPGFAQSFTTLVAFDGTDGSRPGMGSLVQDAKGHMYGTSASGGANGRGTLFEITQAGELTTLYSFCSQSDCPDGEFPNYGLVLGRDGDFYGTTTYGGKRGDGTIFKMTPAGVLTTLHSFDYSDGLGPTQLMQAADGNLYGTTQWGGTSGTYCSGCGTIFKITPKGKFTTLYNFCQQTNCSDGWEPVSGLVQARNGKFYGATDSGGANNMGAVFEVTATGQYTTLYSFCSKTNCSDGAFPVAGLMQAADGFLYGATTSGGNGAWGTIFKISTTGHLTTFYKFGSELNCSDGAYPFSSLIQDASGNFFGTTNAGGINGCSAGYGVVYEISPDRKLTVLHEFDYTDGYYSLAGLVRTNNGHFYGTTNLGGSDGVGTLGTIFGVVPAR
jgi:uncharacterized repeat protein (TIGR03803 family)